jgi:hypothetical protein
VQDELGRFLWCGPVPRTPAQGSGEIVIPLQDWRSWFYRAPIRPLDNGSAYGARRHYFARGVDEAVIYTDLLALALDTPGAPAMVIDDVADTGVDRDVTAYMLVRSIAERLDSIRERGGPEWFCYCTQEEDQTSLLLHVKIAWPERSYRNTPVLLSHKLGMGGIASDFTWPEGQDAPTRVWGYGDGEPTDFVYAASEWPEITDGTEVAWETVLGPLDGVVRSATAFDHADTAIDRSRGLEGTAEFTVVEERLPLGDVSTGDRARVVVETGWVTAEVEAARIVDRVISGGRDQPTQQVITVDLADDTYPDDSDEPGSEAAGTGNEPGQSVDNEGT